jgi:tetratricopeptide (TPR) repeat protein
VTSARAATCMLVLAAWCAQPACRAAPPVESPRTPSPAVIAEIERAEQAERDRRHDLAREHYERAISLARDPASVVLARREFAETLVTWGELAEATAQIESAIAASPTDPSAWYTLGLLRHKQGDIAGALVALGRAKQLAPRDFQPPRAIAALHWSLGEGRAARADPDEAAQHRAAALAEYRAMLELELPAALREKVQWAIAQLSR